ncbi:zinc finger BED domain-containing protein RICESLEEPER 2-like [Benincasa hispida]|uniref:zinc finger BED domain-containing protein RICESLEEPER 2-like n=1 Tax=Benincasa hispida TaxID=102211 RepID=UPI0019029BE7|nr:zinc finger BED domain-containing protein RICESLEEPER 2-like [Benincasa hispida]
MALTANFIDSKWNLHKRILSFTTVENHRGETIDKTIEKNLKSSGIDKVMTLTVDNASSNDTTMTYLVKRFSSGLLLKGEFLHIRCCAHILNFIVCDAFKEHYDCISRIRNAVRFVRSSPARAMKFKKCIKIEKISCKSLVCLDISTRWNFTYMMLDAATKFEKTFDRLEDEEPTFASECQPTKNYWENDRLLFRFLEVFYNVTLKVSGSLYSTSNVIFRQISTTHNCIQENSMDNENLIFVNVVKSMEAKFDKYWGNNEKTNLLLYVAVVLDPRYKLRLLSYLFQQVVRAI